MNFKSTVIRITYHRNNICSHIWKSDRTGMQCSHKELSVFVSIFMLRHIICFNHFLLQDNNQLLNKVKINKNYNMYGLIDYKLLSEFCLTSSTFLEETRSSANCRVFLRTSKSGVLNTLRMSITRS